MKTSLTPLNETFEKGSFDLPCYSCEEGAGVYTSADWIVHFPLARVRKCYFLCDKHLTQWRRNGFGVLYEVDAYWEPL